MSPQYYEYNGIIAFYIDITDINNAQSPHRMTKKHNKEELSV